MTLSSKVVLNSPLRSLVQFLKFSTVFLSGRGPAAAITLPLKMGFGLENELRGIAKEG